MWRMTEYDSQECCADWRVRVGHHATKTAKDDGLECLAIGAVDVKDCCLWNRTNTKNIHQSIARHIYSQPASYYAVHTVELIKICLKSNW